MSTSGHQWSKWASVGQVGTLLRVFLGCACSSRFFHAVCMNEVFFFCNSGFPIVASRLAKRGLAFQGFFCLTACRSGDFFDRSLLRVNFCVLVLSAFWTPHAGTLTQFRTPWWWKENRRTEAWLEPWSWEGAQKRRRTISKTDPPSRRRLQE